VTKPFAIPKALVWAAFQRVKANGGSAGVDDESIDAFEERLGDNLYKLWNRMGSGSYFPPPVKAVPIPKKSGGTRTLGVPTVADRVAQTVVKLALEPLLEPVFDRDSFGYRYYGRFHPTALKPLWRQVNDYLVRWLRRKHKHLARGVTRAARALGRLAGGAPRSFVHWEWGFFPAAR
jgi:retron-type reverse transcriptase